MGKKDAFYFPHDSNAKDDPKCMHLIESLGLEGYGIYWVLVESLRDQPNYKYPLKMLPAIARKYNSTLDKVTAVVSNYSLFDFDDEDFFFSNSLIERMIPLENKRVQARLAGIASAEKRKQISTTVQRPFNDRSTDVQPVEESRAKDKKEELIHLPEKSGDTELSEKEIRFEKFWELYERKGNKQSAKKAFMKLSEVKLLEVAKKVKAYINSTPDLQFRMAAEKYLNSTKEHWNDEIIERAKPVHSAITETERAKRERQFGGGKVSKLRVLNI